MLLFEWSKKRKYINQRNTMGWVRLIGDKRHWLGTANTYWGQAIGNRPNVPSKRNKSGISVIHTKIIIGKLNDLVSTGDTRGFPQGFAKIWLSYISAKPLFECPITCYVNNIDLTFPKNLFENALFSLYTSRSSERMKWVHLNHWRDHFC